MRVLTLVGSRSRPGGAWRGRVLVADGDAAARVRLGGALAGAGFSVSPEASGEGAIAAIEIGRFDAVILDEALLDIDGLNLLSYMRHRRPESPVIVTSRRRSIRSAVSVLRRGAARYVSSRIPAGELVALLDELARPTRRVLGAWRLGVAGDSADQS